MPKNSKDIYYWETYIMARDFAKKYDLPTNRIIEYEIGWAIQLYVSGPYFGSYHTKYTIPY